jgi:hypothetical protein
MVIEGYMDLRVRITVELDSKKISRRLGDNDREANR